MSKLLRVTAPHFVAGTIFEKKEKYFPVHGTYDPIPRYEPKTVWVCTAAAPILRYLVGEIGSEVKAILKKKGYKWEWVSDTPVSPQEAQGDLFQGDPKAT